MPKNKLVIGAIAAGIVVILGLVILYAASPLIAFGTLRDATISHDKDKMDEVVDFPSVRENLKSQISAAIAAKVASSPDTKNNPFMAIGALLAPAITDRMVDSVVTPDGLSNMLTNGKLIKEDRPAGSTATGEKPLESHFEYRTLNRARVSINPKDSPNAKLILTMERRGLFGWKLIRIDLPANVLNDATSPTDTDNAAPAEVTNDNTPSVPKEAGRECRATALVDTPSQEDPKSIWKVGDTHGEVTQYRVDKKTGEGIFCLHGDYCYARFQKGTKQEALKLVNCNIGKVSAFNQADDTDIFYEIDYDPSKNTADDNAHFQIHDKMLKLNISDMEASNAEAYYWEKPDSPCAALVRKALAGDQASAQMLASDDPPAFCQYQP